MLEAVQNVQLLHGPGSREAATLNLLGTRMALLNRAMLLHMRSGEWDEEQSASAQPSKAVSSCIWNRASLAFRCPTPGLFQCPSVEDCLSKGFVPYASDKPTFNALLHLLISTVDETRQGKH